MEQPSARRNFSDTHAHSGKPWGGNRIQQCYDLGEREFGWDRLDPRPGSMRDGNGLVGYGMAAAIRAEHSAPANGRVAVSTDGEATPRHRKSAAEP